MILQGRVDCIRAASSEALEWAKAMCQGEGANVPLESDREDDEEDARKVKFSIYSVSLSYSPSLALSSLTLSLSLWVCRRTICASSSAAPSPARPR